MKIVGPRVKICQWIDDCDIILAALVVELGFNNYSAIVQHPAWHLITFGDAMYQNQAYE